MVDAAAPDGTAAGPHPKVRAIILEASTTLLAAQLVAARLDLAVVNLPVEDPEVEVTPLFDEDLVLLPPRGSPLADRAEISLVELAAHPLVLPPRAACSITTSTPRPGPVSRWRPWP